MTKVYARQRPVLFARSDHNRREVSQRRAANSTRTPVPIVGATRWSSTSPRNRANASRESWLRWLGGRPPGTQTLNALDDGRGRRKRMSATLLPGPPLSGLTSCLERRDRYGARLGRPSVADIKRGASGQGLLFVPPLWRACPATSPGTIVSTSWLDVSGCQDGVSISGSPDPTSAWSSSRQTRPWLDSGLPLPLWACGFFARVGSDPSDRRPSAPPLLAPPVWRRDGRRPTLTTHGRVGGPARVVRGPTANAIEQTAY